MLKIRKEKVGKNDKVYDFVAVINGKGNVVTAATFVCEDDADNAIGMLENLLGYESYPCTPYKDLRNTVDIFFKKLADGKDPVAFDEDYDADNDCLFKMPTRKEMSEEFRQKMKAKVETPADKE